MYVNLDDLVVLESGVEVLELYPSTYSLLLLVYINALFNMFMEHTYADLSVLIPLNAP